MATRIYHVDPDFTLLMARCAYQAYNLVSEDPPKPPPPIEPPNGYKVAGEWTGKNPGIFEDTVEKYGIVFQNEKEPGEIILAFRGTVTESDMEADVFVTKTEFKPYANKTPYPVHIAKGFDYIYTNPTANGGPSMQQQLFKFLDDINPHTIHITGHSLGSALAEVFTMDLYTSATHRNFKVRHYNYACPRIGAQSFANYYQLLEQDLPEANKTVRIVNYEDFIPCLPPELLDFHHGPAYFLIYFYAVNYPESPTERHSLYNYWHVLQLGVHNSPQGYNGTLTGFKGTPLMSRIPDGSYQECVDFEATSGDAGEKTEAAPAPKGEDLSKRKGCLGMFL